MWEVLNLTTNSRELENVSSSIRILSTITVNVNVTQTTIPNYSWTIATNSSLYYFPSVCYIFGREMQKVLNISIGLIASTVGGTYIEVRYSIFSKARHGVHLML